MRQDTALFIFALVLAFLTGNITFFIKSEQSVDINDIQELNEINQDIQRDYSPLLRLDLNGEYPTSSHLSLLTSPQTITNDITTPNAKNCLRNRYNQMNMDFLDKETLWLSYQCKQINDLPHDFFKTPPYMHKNGNSFAYMYYQILPNSSQRQRWYIVNARYMHLNELKQISWPLSQNHQFLYSLEQDIIDRIIQNDKVIYTPDYYLLRTGNMKYFVLDARKAVKYFGRAGYNISNQTKNCFIKFGNVCWTKKPHNLLSFLSQSSIIIFIVTVFVFMLTANALYQRIRHQKREEERKKHALRVLTHELRTPVASMLLKLDQLSEHTKDMPEDMATSVASLESDVYRLKHLAEKSKSYLQTDTGELLDLDKKEIDIKHLCEDIINEYPEIQIDLEQKQNYQLVSDEYWLKMCVTNLIENAIRYGKPPIKLETDSDEQFHYIRVVDQGSISFINLKELMQAKHPNSKGLGMGLIIIQKTLKFLGGDLLLTDSPTTFTIKLKRGNDE